MMVILKMAAQCTLLAWRPFFLPSTLEQLSRFGILPSPYPVCRGSKIEHIFLVYPVAVSRENACWCTLEHCGACFCMPIVQSIH